MIANSSNNDEYSIIHIQSMQFNNPVMSVKIMNASMSFATDGGKYMDEKIDEITSSVTSLHYFS